MRVSCSVGILFLALMAPRQIFCADLCPSTIATKQELEKKLDGWEPYTRVVKHTLKAVVLFQGHPSRQMALKSDEVSERDDRPLHVWRLHGDVEYWILCGYFGTKVGLVKRIPEGARRCEAVWTPHYREVTEVRCK